MNYSQPPTCFDNSNATVLGVLHATVPNCQSGHWKPLTPEWKAAFYTHVAVFGFLFLMLAIACLVLLCKHRRIMRLRRTKTFIAVDVALMILGFTRVAFYALDPYGISGYCTAFACVVTSRLLFSFTFPGLTASYTLVFVTLWHVSAMRLRKSRVQRWKIIIPLSFVHYFFAVGTELVCAFTTYSAIFLLFACEFTFTVWGLVVCVTFLIVGLKILKSVKVTARESSTIRRSTVTISTSILNKINSSTEDSTANSGSVEQSIALPVEGKCREKEDSLSPSVNEKKKVFASRRSRRPKHTLKHHDRAIRKVSIITYAVAVLGSLYSLFGLAQLVMLSLAFFGPCPENEIPTGNDPYIWLALRCASSLMEFLLACLLVYSVNEIRPVLRSFRNLVCSILQCRKIVEADQAPVNGQSSQFSSQTTNKYAISMDYQRRGTLQSLSKVPAETVMDSTAYTQEDEAPVTPSLIENNNRTDRSTNNHYVHVV